MISDPQNIRSRPPTPRGPRPPAARGIDVRAHRSSQRYRPVRNHDVTIEAHTSKIEESIQARIQQREIVALIGARLKEQEREEMKRSISHSMKSNLHGPRLPKLNFAEKKLWDPLAEAWAPEK
jgi:hypothetical protein